MASYLRPRRGTLAAAGSIVLKKGELFMEFATNPGTDAGANSCGKIKMGNGTTTYNSLGYFLNPDTDAVTWASTTATGQPSDWSSYGGKSATSAAQGIDMYADLNALVTGSQNRKVFSLIKNLLFKLATQVTTLNNDIEDLGGDGTYTTVTIAANQWNNGVYSFESLYPKNTYNIEVGASDQMTADEFNVASAATMVGSATANTLTCLGTVPTVSFPVLLHVTKK